MLFLSGSSLFAALIALCPPSPVPLDHRPCVTAHEYAVIQVGDPAPRVRRVWDGPGVLDESGAHVYPSCRGGNAVVGIEGLPSIVGFKIQLAPGADPFG